MYFRILIYLIFIDAALFKTAFEGGQKVNASLGKPAEEKVDDSAKKEDQENKPQENITDAAKDDEKEADGKD